MLKNLRGSGFKGTQYEFDEIIAARDEKRAGRKSELTRLLSSPSFWKPFSCVGALFILYGLSALSIMANYMALFIAKAGVTLDPLLATAFVYLFRLPSAVAAPLLLQRCSKIVVFVVCTFITVLAMIGGNISLRFRHNLVNILFFFCFQWECVPILSPVIPTKQRALGGSPSPA